MWARYRGDPRGFGVVERSDGLIEVENTFGYLAPIAEWLPHEREALDLAHGRCLDVGAGAGRVSLELQSRGHEVVAIDPSEGAIAVCRDRGVLDARVTTVERLPVGAGPFDTVVMYGNNLGLLRDARHAPWLLRRLARLTGEDATILGGCLEPHRTDDPVHLAYQAENVRRGRMPGQIRLRIRYREKATPWFDYLLVSIPELERLSEGTGWRVDDVVHDAGGSPMYVAVLRKG
jgi:SAM-dependent methyltransferase